MKATGYADKIIIEDYVGQKIDDIQKYDVDIFAIGSDWEGKFDYLNEFCQVVICQERKASHQQSSEMRAKRPLTSES